MMQFGTGARTETALSWWRPQLGKGREENAIIHDVRDGYGFGTTYNLLQIQRGIRDYFQIFLPLYS
jgi:hypothetical protein